MNKIGTMFTSIENVKNMDGLQGVGSNGSEPLSVAGLKNRSIFLRFSVSGKNSPLNIYLLPKKGG